MTKTTMRVLLGESRADVRSALRLLLEQDGRVVVVGDVGRAEEVLAEARASCPDVLLLDWELPGGSPAELVSELRTLCPDVRVIALSGRAERRQAVLGEGAHYFVSKGDAPEGLLGVIGMCCEPSGSSGSCG